MIQLTRLNGTEFLINCDHIEVVEATPDTVITLQNDHKWVVRESPDEIVERTVAYKRRIHGFGALSLLSE